MMRNGGLPSRPIIALVALEPFSAFVYYPVSVKKITFGAKVIALIALEILLSGPFSIRWRAFVIVEVDGLSADEIALETLVLFPFSVHSLDVKVQRSF